MELKFEKEFMSGWNASPTELFRYAIRESVVKSKDGKTLEQAFLAEIFLKKDLGIYPTLDEAKAACQADWDNFEREIVKGSKVVEELRAEFEKQMFKETFRSLAAKSFNACLEIIELKLNELLK